VCNLYSITTNQAAIIALFRVVNRASAARALTNGAQRIERADKLVQLVAKQSGMSHPALDAIEALVDRRLEANRRAKTAA
jgi:hypothetical protein